MLASVNGYNERQSFQNKSLSETTLSCGLKPLETHRKTVQRYNAATYLT